MLLGAHLLSIKPGSVQNFFAGITVQLPMTQVAYITNFLLLSGAGATYFSNPLEDEGYNDPSG